MAAPGDVVFCRDEDESSEIWDDTALIKAYDEAVNAVKAQLTSDERVLEKKPEHITGSHKKNSRQGKKKHKKKAATKSQRQDPQQKQWKVGDMCQAVFTEDGEIYRALIKNINEEDATCVIRFLGYGNEETQELEDLLIIGGRSRKRNEEKQHEMVSENESGMEWHRTSPAPHSGHDHRKKQAKAHTSEAGPSHWHSGFPPYGAPPIPTASMPMAPPMFPGIGMPPPPPPPVFHPGLNRNHQSIPNIPPPPPEMSSDSIESDNEALYSMLISWYMSGYHTGYYQGLKQGKKETQSSSEQSDPKDDDR